MTSRPEPTTRRRHDRRYVAILTAVLGLLYLETYLRLSELLPPLAGEVMFGVGVTIAVAATGWFAMTAPPARDDAVRWVENPVEQAAADVERERPRSRGATTRRAVAGA